MKKLLLGLIITFLVILGWCTHAKAEGTKILSFAPELQVEVPEMCPDAHKFAGQIMGVKKYANGNVVVVIEAFNEDQTVFVVILMAKVWDKIGIIAMQVSYLPEGNPDKITSDSYEDLTFAKSGKFSNKLSRVEKLTDFDLIQVRIGGVEV